MIASDIEYRTHLIECFKQMKGAFAQLKTSFFNDASLPLWIETAPSENDARQYAWAAIEQIEYTEGQNPKETINCNGTIASSEETLKCIQTLNQAKLSFKEAILQLKHAEIALNDPTLTNSFEHLLNHQTPEPRQALRRIGLGRLHLKQCYRKLVVLPSAPEKISWTWAHTRAIKRISVEDANRRLKKKPQDAGIEQQLLKLATLPPQEELAIIQELAPHLRANIVYLHEESKRKMVKAALPLFYPAGKKKHLPELRPAGEKRGKDASRMVRSDIKLSDDVFLPALRAHRYLEST